MRNNFYSPPCICNLVGSCMWRVSEILKLWRETSGWRRCTTQPVWRLRWASPQRWAAAAVNINYSIQLRIQRITLCNLSCKRWRCIISKILICCFLQTLGPKSISAWQFFWLHKIQVLNDWIPKVCASGDKSRISRMRHKSEARIRKPANSSEFPFSSFFFSFLFLF